MINNRVNAASLSFPRESERMQATRRVGQVRNLQNPSLRYRFGFCKSPRAHSSSSFLSKPVFERYRLFLAQPSSGKDLSTLCMSDHAINAHRYDFIFLCSKRERQAAPRIAGKAGHFGIFTSRYTAVSLFSILVARFWTAASSSREDSP